MAAIRYAVLAAGMCAAGIASAALLLFTLSLLIDLFRG